LITTLSGGKKPKARKIVFTGETRGRKKKDRAFAFVVTGLRAARELERINYFPVGVEKARKKSRGLNGKERGSTDVPQADIAEDKTHKMCSGRGKKEVHTMTHAKKKFSQRESDRKGTLMWGGEREKKKKH